MKPKSFKKSLLACSMVILTLPAMTAYSAQDPSGTTGTASSTTQGSTTGSNNPATQSGQSAIINDNKAIASKQSDPTAGASPIKHNPTQPDPIENENLQEAVEKCPIQEEANKSMKEAMRIAEIVPNVDSLFNDISEAAQGCFAASENVINLAMEIPDVSVPWSNLGNLVKQQLQKMFEQKKQEIFDKGCEIAQQSALSALEPVQKYINEYQQRANELTGIVGNYGVNVDTRYTGAADFIRSKIEGSKAQISADSERMRGINNSIAQKFPNENKRAVVRMNGNDSDSNNSNAGSSNNSSAPQQFTPPPVPTNPPPTNNGATTPPTNATPAPAPTTPPPANNSGSENKRNPFDL